MRHFSNCLMVFALFCVSGVAQPAESVRRPRVLIDRSHEWLFAFDDLSDRMLRPAGFEVLMCDASLNTSAKLADFDIVYVQQTSNPFEFSDEECLLLKGYVEQGGRLVLTGNPNRPVVKLASLFGFALKPHACRLPLRSTDALCSRFAAQPVLQTRPMKCCLTGPAHAEVLITDQAGVAVAMKADFGKGKVICFADNSAYWDFCAQRDKEMRVPNVPTTVALFRCLIPEFRLEGEGPGVVRLPAERELELAGLLVRYSNPVAVHAKPLIEALPRVADLVAKANGGKAPTDRFIVNILACSGGGWSGGREIGIQCGGSPGANIAVIAHELTHSWTGALPGIIGEGWASIVGMRIATQLGYADEANRERRFWQAKHENAEKGGRKLDIVFADTDRGMFHTHEAKMMWMIERLEAKYGADFMPRFLEICRAVKGRDCPTIHEVLYFLSLTAGQDLSSAYAKLGISYQAPAVISAEELKQKIEAYRQTP